MAFKIKSEEEYQALLASIARKAGKGPREPAEEQDSAKPTRRMKRKPEDGPGQIVEELLAEAQKTKAKKRRGVEETPILTSVRECSIEVEAGKTHATLLFPGARLFTLNEMLAILQYRKYVIFAYKKEWHAKVRQGLKLMGAARPRFESPCKVTLFRQGKKPVDRDSLMVMFKYIIDALKDEPKDGHRGLFPDDNPDIVYDDELIQGVGEPCVGIRVDLILPPPKIPTKNAIDLFESPPAAARKISSPASGVAAPNPTAKPARKAKASAKEPERRSSNIKKAPVPGH